MAKITREELLARYAAGERDFSKLDLGWIDLSGANLREANFTQAKLGRSNLTGAIFERSEERRVGKEC